MREEIEKWCCGVFMGTVAAMVLQLVSYEDGEQMEDCERDATVLRARWAVGCFEASR